MASAELEHGGELPGEPPGAYQPRLLETGSVHLWRPELVGHVDADGLEVRARGSSEVLRLAVSGWEVGGRARLAPPVTPVLGGCVTGGDLAAGPTCLRRVDQDLVGLQAWWESRPDGLEQRFELDAEASEVVIHLRVTGARAEASPDGVELLTPAGERWRYAGLRAWDASGRPLPAQMQLERGGLGLVVDARGASGRVSVDPVLQPANPAQRSGAGLVGESFGASVAAAGDVNGDGYADVIVGAPGFDGEAPGEGRAWLFAGGPAGLGTQAAWFVDPTDQIDAAFGAAVAGAGDVNADGYDDVLVGAPGADLDEVDEGQAWLYLGSPTGLSRVAAWVADPADQPGASFGAALAIAGRTDEDDHDDVLIGSPGWSGEAGAEGRAWLFRGGPAGLEAIAGWTADPTDDDDAHFGASVSSGGDIRGDGFDELLIGAPDLDDEEVRQGRAFLYDGSRWGPRTRSSWDDDAGPILGRRFGSTVVGVGDLNADGLGDLSVAADADWPGSPGVGVVWTFLGTAAGPSSFAIEFSGDTWLNNGFGRALAAAGDVDADGHHDLLMGSPLGRSGVNTVGRASVRLGGPNGFDIGGWAESGTQANGSFGASLAGVGDVNGDGFDDVAVGAPGLDGAQVDQGGISLYLGCGSRRESAGNLLDEDCDGTWLCYADVDDDGYVSALLPTVVSVDRDCDDPGEALLAGEADCDDQDGGVSPAMTEAAGDLVDEDCDGVILCYIDVDRDGYDGGTRPSTDARCDAADEAERSGGADCDDQDAGQSPGQREVAGNGVDENCDGIVTCWADRDGDGFTNSGAHLIPSADEDCLDEMEARSPSAEPDCDDHQPDVYPGATEVCSGVDEDCDGLVDEDEGVALAGERIWYQDGDGDGWGVPAPAVTACAPPPGFAATSTDCLDEGPGAHAVHPEAEDVPANGVDEDCDGRDHCYLDVDLDGWGSPILLPGDNLVCGDLIGEASAGGDCLDVGPGAGLVHPGAVEVCNELDDDCNGWTDDDDPQRVGGVAWALDLDGDGFGGPSQAVASAPPTPLAALPDCDDADAAVSPLAVEVVGDGVDQDCDGVDSCLLDQDGDGFGGPIMADAPALSCGAGQSAGGGDCLDVGPLGAVVYPGAEERCDGADNDCDGLPDDADPDRVGAPDWYADFDGDGFFGARVEVPSCVQPPGTSAVATDCDELGPAAAAIFPGAMEAPLDGVDQDCDGGDACPADLDGDGYGGSQLVASDDLVCGDDPGEADDQTDCRDVGPAAAAVHPQALEQCNGLDDDCDGLFDDGDDSLSGGAVTYWIDVDLDGFAGSSLSVSACAPPAHGYLSPDDCDDQQAEVSPAAEEVAADGVDQDCDGVDHCPLDRDGDGFGGGAVGPGDDRVCGNAVGEATDSTDCLDQGPWGPAVHPSADELCDGLDNDCDGAVDAADAGVVGLPLWYPDLDGDGFAGADGGVAACSAPAGLLPVAEDCDDTTALVGPLVRESCNGVDDDCDGLLDAEDLIADPIPAWEDADGDGWGGAETTLPGCEAAAGLVFTAGDCDDRAPGVFPGAPEAPYDGLDQDCSGGDLTDVDGDGFAGGPLGDDCADGDPAVRPDATERPDGVDEDCDGRADDGTEVYDDDGDGAAEQGGDCDDADPAVGPAGSERCDGRDEDCDGLVDEGTACSDDDGDGLSEQGGDCHDGDPNLHPGGADVPGSGVDGDCDGVITTSDVDGDGFAPGPDCDDTLAAVRPGGVEQVNGIDDDCDGSVDEGTPLRDDDGDSYAELTGDCDDADPLIRPGREEHPSNGRDDDCDGVVDEGGLHHDDDRDGYTEDAGDCDDADPQISPRAAERADGRDQDCDGVVDDGAIDVDGDGFVRETGDCDDLNGWVHRLMLETCDGLDNDCDGRVDEGCFGAPELTPAPAEASDAGCGCQHAQVHPALLWSVLWWRRRRGA